MPDKKNVGQLFFHEESVYEISEGSLDMVCIKKRDERTDERTENQFENQNPPSTSGKLLIIPYQLTKLQSSSSNGEISC